MPDVSEALERFYVRDLKPKAKAIPGLLSRPNDILRYAYIEEVDAVLRRYEDTLRGMFEVASADAGAHAKAASKMMDMREYMDLLRALQVTGSEFSDISERDATLCFCMSRMCVIQPRTERGHMMENGLPFEGFLESLCRISNLTALPTDEEIQAAGFKDAGRYMREGLDDAQRKEMIRQRSREWGEEPESLKQPLCRCVDHLVSILIRQVQDETSRRKDGNLELSKSDLKRWAKHHLDDEDD